MNSAIIGAGGFIGRHLGAALSRLGHCAGFDVTDSPGDGFAIGACDIAHHAPTLPPKTDAVFYLAQFPGYRDFPIHAGDLWAVNVAGALRAIESARAVGARAFLYASTGTVYAPTFAPVAESAPVRRDQPYALSKVAAEEALALIDRPHVCCVRPFGVFGPGQKTMLVPAVAARVRDARPVTIEPNPHDPSDRDGLRISLTDVRDVCAGLIGLAGLMLTGRDVPRVLNLAAREPVSIRRLAATIGEALGVEPVFETADRPRAGDYIADTALLGATIDLPTTPFESSIARVFAPDEH